MRKWFLDIGSDTNRYRDGFQGTDLAGGFFSGSLDCWCKVEAREPALQGFTPQNHGNTIRI
jgi:hypothetical protein